MGIETNEHVILNFDASATITFTTSNGRYYTEMLSKFIKELTIEEADLPDFDAANNEELYDMLFKP